MSSVRLAFVTSVACTPPSGAAGEVPEHPGVGGAEGELARLGAGARAVDVVEDPGDLGRREVGRRAAGRSARGSGPAPPSAASASTRSCVRVSCQTIAREIGSPVARSQTTAVSRWLVMPMAATSAADAPAASRASAITARHVVADLGRRRARPIRRAGSAARARAARCRRARPRGRTGSRGCSWCPGRWPSRTRGVAHALTSGATSRPTQVAKADRVGLGADGVDEHRRRTRRPRAGRWLRDLAGAGGGDPRRSGLASGQSLSSPASSAAASGPRVTIRCATISCGGPDGRCLRTSSHISRMRLLGQRRREHRAVAERRREQRGSSAPRRRSGARREATGGQLSATPSRSRSGPRR